MNCFGSFRERTCVGTPTWVLVDLDPDDCDLEDLEPDEYPTPAWAVLVCPSCAADWLESSNATLVRLVTAWEQLDFGLTSLQVDDEDPPF